MKYVDVYCDNCHRPIVREVLWTKEFIMDTGKDTCSDCLIIHGFDSGLSKEVPQDMYFSKWISFTEPKKKKDFVVGDLYETKK